MSYVLLDSKGQPVFDNKLDVGFQELQITLRYTNNVYTRINGS